MIKIPCYQEEAGYDVHNIINILERKKTCTNVRNLVVI